MSDWGPNVGSALRSIAEKLQAQNSLLTRRNEMLAESLELQKQAQQQIEVHQREQLEALETPRQLVALEQLMAQALELWESGAVMPERFQTLKAALPERSDDDVVISRQNQ